MVAITGVSGSGKSTFLYEILYENLKARFDKRYRTNKVFNAALGKRIGKSLARDTHRPVADRPHAALQPGNLYGPFTFIRDLFADDDRGSRPRVEGVALLL
jgi:excinuclease ABC subunit A